MHRRLRPIPWWQPWTATGLIVFALSASAASSDAASKPTRAPSFALPTRSGLTVAFDSLQAKVVLVDFWASWCVPCRKSFPWMNELQERYGAKGLAIVAINLDKDRGSAEKFLAANPATFTIAFDPAGKIAEAYLVAAMPSTYLLAPNGAIIVSHRGFDPKKTGEIESHIAEACTP